MDKFYYFQTLNGNWIFVYECKPKKVFLVYIPERNIIQLPEIRWQCHMALRKAQIKQEIKGALFKKVNGFEKSVLWFARKKFEKKEIFLAE